MQTFVDTSDISENEWCPLFGKLPQAQNIFAEDQLGCIWKLRKIWGVDKDTGPDSLENSTIEKAKALYKNAPEWLSRWEKQRQTPLAFRSASQDCITQDCLQESKAIAILGIFSAVQSLKDPYSRYWAEKTESLTTEARAHPETYLQLKKEGVSKTKSAAGSGKRGHRSDFKKLLKRILSPKIIGIPWEKDRDHVIRCLEAIARKDSEDDDLEDDEDEVLKDALDKILKDLTLSKFDIEEEGKTKRFRYSMIVQKTPKEKSLIIESSTGSSKKDSCNLRPLNDLIRELRLSN